MKKRDLWELLKKREEAKKPKKEAKKPAKKTKEPEGDQDGNTADNNG